MNKVLKFIGIAAGAMLGLVVLVFIVLKLISDDQYKEWITSAVQSATGRDFSIEDLQTNLNTSLWLKASGVSLANAEWSNTPNQLAVGQLEAEIDLISLLGGVAEVRTVIEHADVLVETNSEGSSNWEMDTVKPKETELGRETDEDSAGVGLPIRPLIRELRIENTTVTIADGVNGGERKGNIENILLETPEEDLTLSVSGKVGDIPITMEGNLGPLDEVLTNSSSPVEVNGKVDENTFKLAGHWGPLLPKPNLQLSLTAEAPSTLKLIALAGVEQAELGGLRLSTEVAAKDGHFSISRIVTNLDGELATASVEGSVGDLMGVNGIELTASASTDALHRLAERLNVTTPLDLPPDVMVSASIRGELDSLGVEDFRAEIRDEGVVITVAGTIGNALGSQSIDAAATAKIESTTALSKYAKLDLPDLGAIDISAKVQSAGEKIFSLNDLNAVLNGGPIDLRVTGGVSDLIEVSGIDAAVKLDVGSFSEQNIADLDRLLKQLQVKVTVPFELLPASASLSANVSGGLDQLRVADIDVNVRDPGILITLSGDVANAMGPEGVDAKLTFSSETLSALSKYAGMELPEVGALDVTGRVLSGEKTYRLEDLDAKLSAEDFNVTLTAGINDLLAVRGINATLDASVDSLASLSAIAKKELPATDEVVVHATVDSGSEGADKPATVSLTAETGGASVALDGVVYDLESVLSDPKSADNIEVSLHAEASSLTDFNKLVQDELPDKGPLKLTGIVRLQQKEFNLEDFQFNLAKQSVNGEVGVKLAETDEELSTVKGQLNIPYLDLSPFLIPKPAPEKEPAPEQTAGEKKPTSVAATKDIKEEMERAKESEVKASDRLFSTNPLRLEELRKIDADFAITADRLVLGKTDATDLSIVLSLKEGLLTVDPIKGIAGPGTIDGRLTLDGRTDWAKLDARLTVDDLPMPNLGGGLDFNVELVGDGQSLAALMGGLDGQILVVIKDATLEHSYATNFGSGLLSFSGGKDYTKLECGILRIDIEDGIANFENKLAAQLTDVNWKGGGTINLKTEKLDAGIVPKPRKGIGLQGMGGLAGLVHLGGTLKRPRVQLDPKDVAVKYGKYMAYVSTGGLSLLAEAVINKSQANVDLCKKILDGTVFDEEAAAERASVSDEAQPAATEPEAQGQSETEGGALTDKAQEQESKVEDQAPADEKKKSSAPSSKNVW